MSFFCHALFIPSNHCVHESSLSTSSLTVWFPPRGRICGHGVMLTCCHKCRLFSNGLCALFTRTFSIHALAADQSWCPRATVPVTRATSACCSDTDQRLVGVFPEIDIFCGRDFFCPNIFGRAFFSSDFCPEFFVPENLWSEIFLFWKLVRFCFGN